MNLKNLVKILFHLSIFFITGISIYTQLYLQQGSDIIFHVGKIMPIINGTFFLPHPLFHYTIYGLYCLQHLFFLHFTMPEITIVFLSSCATFAYHLTYRCFRHFFKDSINDILLHLYALLLIFITAIHIPFFSSNFYLGHWSPTLWHNPTFFFLKPLAIASAFLVATLLIEKQLKNKTEYFILSTCLALSALAKPSFVFSFIPAIGLFILIFELKNFKLYKQIFYILIPTLLVLVWQYLSTYFVDITATNDLKDKIIFTFFGVTKVYSPNVLISLLLAIAFPLMVCLIDFKHVIRNKYLVLMWLNTIVAYLQSSFLAEKYKFESAAFSFGYSLSLWLLFIFSLIHFIQYIKTEKDTIVIRIKKIFVLTVFLLHFISGICYYYGSIFYNRYN